MTEYIDLDENLVISQLVNNVYYRDKVLIHIKSNFFENEDNEKLFKAIYVLCVKENIQKLDRTTLSLRYKNDEHLNEIFGAYDYPNENIELLIKDTEKWGRLESFKSAIISSVNMIKNKEDINNSLELVEKSLAFKFESNSGLNYIKDIDRRFEYYNKVEEKIHTSFQMFDMYTNGGIPKKTLSVFLGQSNIGKTMLGTNLAVNFLLQEKSGIYVTLELAEELITRRIDSALVNIPYYSLPKRKNEFINKFSNIKKGQLYIREFPPSKACSLNLKTYMRELELVEKFKIDFLIVDYIQLMKANGNKNNQNSYDKFKEVAEELRELASEYDIPIITFSQIQRGGYDTSEVSLSHVSDSMAIINTSDLVLGITQTPEESEEGLQQWKIIKSRLGAKGVSFRVQFDSEILKFKEILNDDDFQKLENYKERQLMYENYNDKKDKNVFLNVKTNLGEKKAEDLEEECHDFENYLKTLKSKDEMKNNIDKFKGFN